MKPEPLDAYRDVDVAGRRSRLREKQKENEEGK